MKLDRKFVIYASEKVVNFELVTIGSEDME